MQHSLSSSTSDASGNIINESVRLKPASVPETDSQGPGRFALQGQAFALVARWHTTETPAWPSRSEWAPYAKAMEILGENAYEIIVQTAEAWAARQAVTR